MRLKQDNTLVVNLKSLLKLEGIFFLHTYISVEFKLNYHGNNENGKIPKNNNRW